MKLFVTLSLLIFLSGCADPVSVDYDSQVNFNQINQYRLLPPQDQQDPLIGQRVEQALDAELIRRGWQKLPQSSNEGDGRTVAIAYFSWVENRYNDRDVSIGIGGSRSGDHTHIGGSVNIPIGSRGNRVQVIRIDMVQNGHLIWRASDDFSLQAEDTPAQRTAQTRQLVTELLGQFPPASITE